MQNDPRDRDGKKLIRALTLMGRDLGARQRVMALLASAVLAVADAETES